MDGDLQTFLVLDQALIQQILLLVDQVLMRLAMRTRVWMISSYSCCSTRVLLLVHRRGGAAPLTRGLLRCDVRALGFLAERQLQHCDLADAELLGEEGQEVFRFWGESHAG